MSRPTGISVLGALYILAGIVWIAMAMFLGALASSYMNNSMFGGSIGAIGGFIAGIAVFVAIIEFAIAGALLSGKNWGRVIVIVLVIIDLILQVISIAGANVFALGFIILDLIVLYYMWRPHVIAYFKGEESNERHAKFYCKYCGFPAMHYDDINHHMLHCSKKPDAQKEDNARNIGILKERLAKGEITKDEYDDLKKEFEA